MRDRTDAGLDVDELRLSYTDGYIDDYMGSAFGRRRAFAVAAVFRGILRRCGFPLKASKECLPARRMTALDRNAWEINFHYETNRRQVRRCVISLKTILEHYGRFSDFSTRILVGLY